MNRTIRLFVSSTFSDFKAERDLLQREVFPKLQQLCLSKGLRFQAIDLRWGVPEEAGKDNRTMRLCLRELKRCQEGEIKPNFLVLLGDRYGWRPLPETITAEVFEELESFLTQRRRGAELLGEWYRLDENAVPTEYVLKPRTGRFEDFDVWSAEVEDPLLAAMEQYSGGYEPAGEQQARSACCTAKTIGLSATHQEILCGALALPKGEARQHVHAFRRQIADPPATPHSTFVDCLPGGLPDDTSRQRLDRLCAELEGHLGKDNLHDYTVPWHDEGAFRDGDLESFVSDVFEVLKKVIDAQVAALNEVSREDQEEQAHHAFCEVRRYGFTGRDEPLAAIEAYLRAGSSHPLAIIGPAGSGKSALLAEAVHRAKGNSHSEIISRFIGATPGSTDLHELLRELVARIRARYPRQVEQGEKGVPPVAAEPSREPREKVSDDREIPSEINPLTIAFHEALGRATAERPLWLFLDALDQFRDANLAASLSWLPQKLPEHFRIVVSAADPSTAGASAYAEATADKTNPLESSRLVAPAVLSDPRATIIRNLARIAPGGQALRLDPLTPADGEALLKHWMDAADRRLDESQRKPILDAFAVEGNALWLRVAAAEAARWPRWHTPVPPPPGLHDLLATVLERLSRNEEHGAVFVKRALGYLACARHGLAEDEIIGVIGADPTVMAYLIARSPTERVKPEADRIKALPVAIWVRFYGDIAFYLSERRNQGAALFGFYHRSFGEAVERFCLQTDADRLPLHETMAQWFGEQPWFLPPMAAPGNTLLGAATLTPDPSPSGRGAEPLSREGLPNTRKASELPFHLQRVAELTQDKDSWDPLVDVLCDLDCVETKARSGLIYELVGDYNAALTELREFRDENERLAKRDAAMMAYNKALREYAVVRCDWWFAKERGETRPEPPYPPLPPQIQDESQTAIPEDFFPRAARLRHFANFVNARLGLLATTPHDTLPLAYNYAEDGPVFADAEHRIASWEQPWLRRSPRSPISPLRPQCLRTLEGHANWVSSVSVSSDGRCAVSGEGDWRWQSTRNNTLRVWNLKSGVCLRTLEGHSDGVVSVSVSPETGRTVSGSRDGSIRLWNLDSGQCLRILKGHAHRVNCVSVCPDGHRALAGSSDKTLRLWDLETGACLRTLEGHTSSVYGVSVSPDGHRALSGSDDKTLRVWDLETGQCLRTLEGHASWVRSVSVSPDGRRAVSGSRDTTLRVWDLETGQCMRTLEGHRSLVLSVSVSPDGRRAVSGGGNPFGPKDNSLRVWDLETGDCLCTLEGHSDCVESASVCPDGRHAVSGSRDTTLRVWDLETSQCLRTLEGHGDGCETWVSVSLDGRRAVSGGGNPWFAKHDNDLLLWDLEIGRCLRTLEGHKDWVCCVSVSTDGRCVVSGSHDKTLRVWDLETGQCLRILQGHTAAVWSMSVSPDGRCVVSGSHDKTLRVWDLETGQCLRILQGHTDSINSVSVSSDGRRAVSGSFDKTLRVWDLETGACLRTLKGHANWVRSVSVSPDGWRAVSWEGYCREGAKDYAVRVWDLETGQCLRTLQGHAGEVNNVSVSPDGRRVVSCSTDKTLRVWDLETGECLHILEGHREAVWSESVSPDGRRSISGSWDKTLRVWDLESGRQLVIYHAESSVPFVTFASGQDRIICGTADGQIHFLTPVHFPQPGPPIITAVRLWHFGDNGAPGCWDDRLTALCPHCGQRFPVRDDILGQQIACPLDFCGKPLQLNPFVVDGREGGI